MIRLAENNYWGLPSKFPYKKVLYWKLVNKAYNNVPNIKALSLLFF